MINEPVDTTIELEAVIKQIKILEDANKRHEELNEETEVLVKKMERIKISVVFLDFFAGAALFCSGYFIGKFFEAL